MQREDKGHIFPVKQPHICHLHINIFPPVMRLTRSIPGQLCVPEKSKAQKCSPSAWLSDPLGTHRTGHQLLGGTMLRAGRGRHNNQEHLESGPMDPLGHLYQGWS